MAGYWRAGIGVLAAGLLAAGGARAQDAAGQRFTAADHNLSFTLPAGWRAAEEGATVHLTAPDGAKYTLAPVQAAAPAGGTTLAADNPALRSAAETMVKPLLTDSGYAGVKLLAVDAGDGAIYRFRGKGAKSGSDLAEVWFAVVGPHTVALRQEAAPEPDHGYEIGTLFKSLTFADAPAKAAGRGARGGQAANRAQGAAAGRRQAATTTAQSAAPAATRAAATAPATTASAKQTIMEQYEGRLTDGDVGLTLTLNHGGTVVADWTRTVAHPLHYAGAYTGEDGAYSATLKLGSDTPVMAPQTLKLFIKRTGGMATGQYALGDSGALHPIADLRLVALDEGDGILLRGSNLGHHFTGSRATNRTNRRRGNSNRAARNAMNRARRLLNAANRRLNRKP